MEKNIFKKFITILVLFIFFISSSFGVIIPSDEPTSIFGSVLVNSAPIDSSFTIEGLVNGNLYKTQAQSNNTSNYFITLGGKAGDTASISVCGISGGSTSFLPFQTSNIDINISLQADGTTGCTCDGVCGGGTCLNPGLNTGVCSSSTAPQATSGSSSGGGGSSYSGLKASNTSSLLISKNTTSSTPLKNSNITNNFNTISNLHKSLLSSLGYSSISGSNTKLVASKLGVVDSITFSEVLISLSPADQDLILASASSSGLFNGESSSDLYVYEVNVNGNIEKVSIIEKKVKVKINSNTTSVKIFESIPKFIVSSVSSISGNFVTIKNDPIILFEKPVSEVKNNEVLISYSLKGDTINTNEKIGTVVSYVEKEQNLSLSLNNSANNQINNLGGNITANIPTIFEAVLALLIIILGIGFFVYRRKKNN